MKVGIVTFQWGNNYGGVLQAHALQSFLQGRGHDVQIIDYRVVEPPSWYRRFLAKTPDGCFRKWMCEHRNHLFEKFRRNYLMRTSEVFRTPEQVGEISDRFDVFITGSDQIWNPRYLSPLDGLFDLFFLSFASPRTRRIAYAASFGHSDTTTMKEEWQKILREKLLEMDAISTREPSGVALVRSLCGRSDAVYAVDPTLLLNRTHYEEIADVSKSRGGYLFSYMLHGMEGDAVEACQQIAVAKDLPVVKCDAQKTRVRRGYVLPSPTGWLQRIGEASFMVTNSFHGVVFCLVFHTPFVALLISGRTGSMNSRIVELLEAVGLTHRIIAINEDLPEDLSNEEINWSAVDQKIASMRAESVNFLIKQGL